MANLLRSILVGSGSSRSSAMRSRAEALLGALGTLGPPSEPSDASDRPSPGDIVTAMSNILDSGRPELCWLAVSVMSARLPDVGDVEHLSREIRKGGDPTDILVRAADRGGALDTDTHKTVSVYRGRVLVDVDRTSRTPLGTGIQRVVRQAARRWARHPETALVGWTDTFDALRPLTEAQCSVALGDPSRPQASDAHPDAATDVIVPWRSTLIVPELAVEMARPAAIGTVARFARGSTCVIGYDCVPLTMPETSIDGMSSDYLRYLAACAHVTRIAAISDTAALEFKAWRSTLASRGLQGPGIETVELALEAPAPAPSASDVADAGRLLGGHGLPVVLVVGSHEPRKNHLAVLHAAELLWRQGERFELSFVGGDSWKSGAFFERLQDLQGSGRPLQALSAISDRLVWAAYRVASCSVFVSLHEGFGLPIVESLAAGTPVVTSNYGAMADNARHGGCLLVDPRDPAAIASAIRRLLSDSQLAETLRRQARAAPTRTWDTYAEEAWDFLVDGKPPRSDVGIQLSSPGGGDAR